MSEPASNDATRDSGPENGNAGSLHRIVGRQIWEKQIPIPTTVEEVERVERLMMYRSREARSLCSHYELQMIVKRCSLCYRDFKACPKCNESVCPDCETPNADFREPAK